MNTVQINDISSTSKPNFVYDNRIYNEKCSIYKIFQLEKKAIIFLPGPALFNRVVNWVKNYARGRKYTFLLTIYLRNGTKIIFPHIFNEELETAVYSYLREVDSNQIARAHGVVDRLVCFFCCKEMDNDEDHTRCCMILYQCSSCNAKFTKYITI